MNKRTNQQTMLNAELESISRKSLLELGNAPIFIVNHNLEIVYFNEGASLFLREDYLGQHISECILWNDDLNIVDDMFNSLLMKTRHSFTTIFSCEAFTQLRMVVELIKREEQLPLFYCKCYPIDAAYSWLNSRSGAGADTYRKVLNEAVLVKITSPNGSIMEVNDYYCQRTGYERSELLGSQLELIDFDHHDKSLTSEIRETLLSHNVWKGRIKSVTKTGMPLWLTTTIVPFYNIKGELFQIASIQVDITEMINTKMRLREQDAFMLTITDNIPVLISYWDTNLKCKFANKIYCDFFDVSKENVLKWILPNAYEHFNVNLNMQHIQLALHGTLVSFEATIGIDKERSKTFAMKYIPDIQEGKVQGFTAIGIDINDIKTAQSEIGSILSNMADGFFSVDKHFQYTYANPQLDRLAGCDMQRHIGKNLWDVFPEAKVFNFYNASWASMEDGEYRCVEDYNPWQDIWQETRIYPSDKGLSVFVHDIGARKKEEQHLRILTSLITQVDNGVLCIKYVDENIHHGKILYINNAFEEVLGMEGKNLQGIAFSEIIGHPCFNLLNEALDELTSQRHFNYDFLFTNQHGEPKWSEVSYTIIKSDTKPFDTYLLVYLREITRRKVTEQIEELKVRATEIIGAKGSMGHALSELLNMLPEYVDYKTIEVWLVEHDKRYITIAARNARYPHLSAGIESDSSLINLRKGEGIAGNTWAIGSITTKDVNKLPNGRKCSIISYPLIQNGQTIGVFNISVDIDDVRIPLSLEVLKHIMSVLATELERKKIEIRYEHLFNAGPDPLALCSPEGELYNYNPLIKSLLPGTQQKERIASILDIIHLDDIEKTIEILHLAYSTDSVQRFETRLRQEDADQRWIDWTVAPFMQERLIFCMGKETTEMRLMQLTLEKHLSIVQQKNEFLSRLSWTQSHLVRAPLANILALAELLKDKSLNGNEANEILSDLLKSANALDDEVKKSSQLIKNAEK